MSAEETDRRLQLGPVQAPTVHPTAVVSAKATLGKGACVWQFAIVRAGASIGRESRLGAGVYVDVGVTIGDRCKIQNYACIYQGVTIGDGVFLGQGVKTTNDRYPRALNPDGEPKGPEDWELEETFIADGASIGAGAILLPGIRVGRFAMVGAGTLVHDSVPDHALVVGTPGRVVGSVCYCGTPQATAEPCPACGWAAPGTALQPSG